MPYLDDSIHFGGSISGFNGDDKLDVLDILFSSATLNYTANQAGTGGTLSVTDGAHTANITLLGQFDAASFQESADNKDGTFITYHHIA
jgi:large repetitive protein